jgi:nitroreductase
VTGADSLRMSGATVELTEAVRRRRMTRNFSGRPLAGEVVDALLDGALRAPSAGNTQGREFVVLSGADQTRRYWEASTDEAWRTGSRRFVTLSRAPVVVLPFVDPDAYVARYREPDKARNDGAELEWVVPFWWVDAAFATMALLLGAVDRGLGAAFLGNFRGEEALRAELGVPGRFRWLGAVLLGEPAEPDPTSRSAARGRPSLEESVHRGGW